MASISVLDALRFLCRVVLPTWAKGIFLRRRAAVAWAERRDLDRSAVHFLQRLRRAYGGGPLLLPNPGRPQALILTAADMKRVLDGAPQPFTPASREKQAALAHFEPHVSLITRGPSRAPRRHFHEEVLQSDRRVHDLAPHFLDVVREEATRLLDGLADSGTLAWPAFTEAWFNAVRHIVLGADAHSNPALTDSLARLRASANWVFLRPEPKALRAQYQGRLRAYLTAAAPGSLAAAIARRDAREDERPLDQVTQWLFAFDAGGMTTFCALALFASHPLHRERASLDVARWRSGDASLTYLRAGFLEAVRLWPTTPVILRETTEPTSWGGAILPAGAGLIIYVPFFHRDNERLADADRFAPEMWLGRDRGDAVPFVPFGAGPAACPGRNLVALIGSAWLAALLGSRHVQLLKPALRPDRPLPGTLDHFSLRFGLAPMAADDITPRPS